MMNSWSVLPTLSAPMPFHMAFDEFLFRSLEQGDEIPSPLLRFYFSSEPWVTVGYSHQKLQVPGTNAKGARPHQPHQPLERICRRITGGGRVEHGKDVIFSIVARKEDHDAFKSVRISYLKIHEAVKWAWEKLGYEPRFYRCDERLEKGADCFRFPIATDLAVKGGKVAGGAQRRSAGILLHEESVKLLPGVDAEQLIENIKAGFESVFEMKLQPLDLNPEWLMKAEKSKEVAGSV